jgi:Domain of unknown function (DUF4160)
MPDHPPPHFHALYGGQMARIDVDALAVIDGRLPPRALGLVMEWAALHQDELREAFQRAANMQPPEKVDPLRNAANQGLRRQSLPSK